MRQTRSPCVPLPGCLPGVVAWPANRAVGILESSPRLPEKVSWRRERCGAFWQPGSAPIEVQATPESTEEDSTPPLLGVGGPSRPRCCAGASQRIPAPCPGRVASPDLAPRAVAPARRRRHLGGYCLGRRRLVGIFKTPLDSLRVWRPMRLGAGRTARLGFLGYARESEAVG